MKKIILMCCLLLSFSLVGCGEPSSDESTTRLIDDRDSDRFLSIYIGCEDYIFVDIETRVQYLFVKDYSGGGLTVMVDADGKPILYEGEIN